MSIAVLVFATGCASEMKKGQKDLDRGNFAAAVSHFEAAVNDAKPKGSTESARDLALRYRKSGVAMEGKKLNEAVVKLAEALERAAQRYYNNAMAAHGRAMMADAKMNLNKALSYIPDLPGARELLDGVVKAQDQALALRAQAQQQAQARQWDQAVQTMSQALTADATLPQGQSILKGIKQDAYRYFCAAAKQALDQDNRAEVKKQIQEARRFADGQEAKQYLQIVEHRDRADALVKKAADQFQGGAFQKALESYQQAKELYPEKAGLDERIQQSKERICDGYIEQGKKDLSATRFFAAMRQFSRSKGLLPDYGRVDDYLAVVQERIAEQHFSQARQYQQQGLYGNAVLYQVIGLRYQPQNVTVARDLQVSMQAVRKAVTYTIGFVGFEAKAADRVIADRAEARGLQHLNRIKPKNVSVKDLLTWRPQLEAQRRTLNDLLRDGRQAGIDAMMVGKLLENNVRVTTKTSYGQSEYQHGMKAVQNPEYDKAMNRYNQASQNLQHAQRNLQAAEQALNAARSVHQNDPSTVNRVFLETQTHLTNTARSKVQQCQRELSNADYALKSTPSLINVPDMRKHRYPIYEKTKTAKVNFQVKMVDTVTGSVLYTDQFEGQFVKTDRTVDEDRVHNVTGDPWDVPDDGAMSAQALEQVTAKLHASIELATQKHGHRFVVQMRQAESKGQTEQVVENAIKYLFAYPINPQDTERLLKAMEPVIAKQADLVNLPQLLRQYCGVMRGGAQLPMAVVYRSNQLQVTKAKGINLGVSLPCVLLAIEGKPVKSLDDVAAVLKPYGPGDEIQISVSTKGRKQTKTVILSPSS